MMIIMIMLNQNIAIVKYFIYYCYNHQSSNHSGKMFILTSLGANLECLALAVLPRHGNLGTPLSTITPIVETEHTHKPCHRNQIQNQN
ncbi:hypothetical protein B0O99DRAFT_619050 [Bisporella sp. PMI_857]|nr:hypothetical protein B0O99DRAFT_619050 [Bisporella sp. PMI_857]